jgi:hypothetical protein
MRENKTILIASADKNLGPVGIKTEQYIKLGLDHLFDTFRYKLLTERDAHQDDLDLKTDWTVRNRKALTDDETHFIRHILIGQNGTPMATSTF